MNDIYKEISIEPEIETLEKYFDFKRRFHKGSYWWRKEIDSDAKIDLTGYYNIETKLFGRIVDELRNYVPIDEDDKIWDNIAFIVNYYKKTLNEFVSENKIIKYLIHKEGISGNFKESAELALYFDEYFDNKQFYEEIEDILNLCNSLEEGNVGSIEIIADCKGEERRTKKSYLLKSKEFKEISKRILRESIEKIPDGDLEIARNIELAFKEGLSKDAILKKIQAPIAHSLKDYTGEKISPKLKKKLEEKKMNVFIGKILSHIGIWLPIDGYMTPNLYHEGLFYLEDIIEMPSSNNRSKKDYENLTHKQIKDLLSFYSDLDHSK